MSKRHADQSVLADVSLELHPGDRVGLIGRNGSGKTTLLRLMAGLDATDAGSVTRYGRTAHLEQREPLPDEPLWSACLPVRARESRFALESAESALASPSDAALAGYDTAERAWTLAGGYDLEHRARSVLQGLGLDPDRPAVALSGGESRRSLLARLLLEPADHYLLDEPTNHLDRQSLEWLEGWVLAASAEGAAVLVVSHDRAFLDATVERTAEIERGRLIVYAGGYTQAVAARQGARERARVAYDAHSREVGALATEARRLAQAASSAGRFDHRRMKDKNTMIAKSKAETGSRRNASRAKAIEARIERTAAPPKPHDRRELTRLEVGSVGHGPAEVLTARGLRLQRNGAVVLDVVDLAIRRGERVALEGPNGAGKSTLLAAVLGCLAPAAGSIELGRGLSVFAAGQHGEELDSFVTLADALLGANASLDAASLHARLADLGLPKEPGRPVASLSGGERTRLALARLAVTRAHLLVLDEPSNHLDIEGIEALEKLLATYSGTLLFASHDRRLVRAVATRRLEIEGGRVSDALEAGGSGQLEPDTLRP